MDHPYGMSEVEYNSKMDELYFYKALCDVSKEIKRHPQRFVLPIVFDSALRTMVGWSIYRNRPLTWLQRMITPGPLRQGNKRLVYVFVVHCLLMGMKQYLRKIRTLYEKYRADPVNTNVDLMKNHRQWVNYVLQADKPKHSRSTVRRRCRNTLDFDPVDTSRN